MGAVINISVMEDNVIQSGVLNIVTNRLGYKPIKQTDLSHQLSANLYNDICLSVLKIKVLFRISPENKLLPILRIWRLPPYESDSVMMDWGKASEKNDRQSIGNDVDKTQRQFANTEDD